MKIVPIKQCDDSACGPTCIKMAADYFGLSVSIEDIAKISKYVQKGGLYNQDLVDTLEKLGLHVRKKTNVTWADLRRSNTENVVIIVSWMKYGYMGHFSIVDSVEKDSITLSDPEHGKAVKMEKIIFLRMWMDYDPLWFPSKNTDIQLRWMAVISAKGKRKARSK